MLLPPQAAAEAKRDVDAVSLSVAGSPLRGADQDGMVLQSTWSPGTAGQSVPTEVAADDSAEGVEGPGTAPG